MHAAFPRYQVTTITMMVVFMTLLYKHLFMVFMTIVTMVFCYQMLPGSDYTLVITSVTMQDDAKFQCQVLFGPER